MSPRWTIEQLRAYQADQPKQPKPSKYRNKKVVYDGIEFDSIKEKDRYVTLKLMLKAGEISNLKLQEPFPVIVCREKICTYYADFYYKDKAGKRVIEDSKGFATPVFKLKRRLVEAVYGIKILTT